MLVGACSPILISTFLNFYFELSSKKVMEFTLVFCIPIAAWIACKINQRWHDDNE